MQLGDPHKLLLEELVELLKESGELFGTGLDAQYSSENTEVMASMAWYLFNLKSFNEMIALAASALSESDRQGYYEFVKMADSPKAKESHVTLYDLRRKHLATESSYLRIKLAYLDIAESKPLNVIFTAAEHRWRLAAGNLKQSLDA